MAGIKNRFLGSIQRLYKIDGTIEIESQRKRVLLNIIFTIFFIFMPPYMTAVFVQGYYMLALLDFLALALIVFTALYLRKTGDFNLAGYMTSVFMGGFFLYLIAGGGIDNTGPLWTFPYPLLVLFLLGLRKGTIAIAIFLAFVAVIFFFPGSPLMLTVYPKDFEIRFFSSFLAVSSISYFSENIRARINQAITSKTRELEQTLEALKNAENERSLLQEELLSAKKLEAIGTLAGGMAHEFNNQVSVILGNVDMLHHFMEPNETDMKRITAIRDASDRIAGLTDQMLSFSRKQILQMEPVNINQLIKRSEYSIRRTTPEDIQVIIELEPELGVIDADPGQIIQVILDLVENSCHAMEHQDMGTLIIKTKNEDRWICLSVQDTGTGMDEETLQKIFEPFFTSKQPGKGIGLGLSFVYGTVKQHNGAIDVTSSPVKGTTVTIYLPTVDPAA
jgi:signal transduction histidine kinase